MATFDNNDLYPDLFVKAAPLMHSLIKNHPFTDGNKRTAILMLLDKVEATGNRKYLPILESWELIDYKKARERIGKIIDHLKQREPKN